MQDVRKYIQSLADRLQSDMVVDAIVARQSAWGVPPEVARATISALVRDCHGQLAGLLEGLMKLKVTRGPFDDSPPIVSVAATERGELLLEEQNAKRGRTQAG